MIAPHLVQAESVTFAYGSGGALPAVRGVTLSVARGDYLGLLGANGAGKSTLLRLLAGTLVPQTGSVLLDGRTLAGYARPALARRIAVLPQRLHVAFDTPVEELVLLGRTPHGGALAALRGPSARDRHAVERALDATGTARFRGRTMRQLSGGEQQRVALALALAQEADVLLLDEPTSHLDPGHAVEVLDLVEWLRRERGLTVVAVFHDLNLAALYASRLAVMREGALLAQGAPEDVIKPDVLSAAYGPRLTIVAHPQTGVAQVLPAAPGVLRAHQTDWDGRSNT
jgi:iron complex transport system ATP-binding protein